MNHKNGVNLLDPIKLMAREVVSFPVDQIMFYKRARILTAVAMSNDPDDPNEIPELLVYSTPDVYGNTNSFGPGFLAAEKLTDFTDLEVYRDGKSSMICVDQTYLTMTDFNHIAKKPGVLDLFHQTHDLIDAFVGYSLSPHLYGWVEADDNDILLYSQRGTYSEINISGSGVFQYSFLGDYEPLEAAHEGITSNLRRFFEAMSFH